MHHPGDMITGNAVSQGISPMTWIFLSIGLLIFGVIIYFIIKAGKNKW